MQDEPPAWYAAGMTRLIAIAAACVLACTTPGRDAPETEPSEPPTAEGERDYVFVFIRTGPKTDLAPEERAEAFQGHFSNMARMAEAGDLLIAGPFAPPLGAPDHRGLFVIDRDDLDAGMALAHTDPTTIAGVFVLEGHLFTTDSPLTRLPALEKADEAARLADPEIPDEWVGRRYMLATAPYDARLSKRAAGTTGVLIAGRLHGSGEDGADQLLVWIDAEDPDHAEAILPDRDAWTLHGWYGSKMVASLD